MKTLLITLSFMTMLTTQADVCQDKKLVQSVLKTLHDNGVVVNKIVNPKQVHREGQVIVCESTNRTPLYSVIYYVSLPGNKIELITYGK